MPKPNQKKNKIKNDGWMLATKANQRKDVRLSTFLRCSTQKISYHWLYTNKIRYANNKKNKTFTNQINKITMEKRKRGKNLIELHGENRIGCAVCVHTHLWLKSCANLWLSIQIAYRTLQSQKSQNERTKKIKGNSSKNQFKAIRARMFV